MTTTIFAAIAAVSIVTDDIRRIPLAYPVLLQLAEGSQRLPPGSRSALLPEHGLQGLADQSTSRSPSGACSPIYSLQKLTGKRNHHLSHCDLTSRSSITLERDRGHTFYITIY